MANSVDPDQTAQEQSDLSLQCLHIYHFISNFGVHIFRTFIVEQKQSNKLDCWRNWERF